MFDMADPIFKKYDPNQPTFLPPSLDELLGQTRLTSPLERGKG